MKKICAIICEYNPFHNGHRYLIEQAKERSGCDFLVCIMSGPFTQRGEMCIMDKYDRARHAVLGGADCVIELPAAFAVAPAEIFAKGAVKILAQIPEVCLLSFGCEEGTKEEFLRAARLLAVESEQFKQVLSQNLSSGESYIRSFAAAFGAAGGDREFLSGANNILGLEYTKAIINSGANIDILPVKREGSGFNDGQLRENFSSANAIRKNINSPLVKQNVPPFVLRDLKDTSEAEKRFEGALQYALFRANESAMKTIFGCGEGLENRLKKFANLPFEKLLNEATSKRYSSARIKRILCANLLEISSNDCLNFLSNGLKIGVLAVKKEVADQILPIIARASSSGAAAEKCAENTENAYNLWRHLHRLPERRDFVQSVKTSD